ncbi:hypothetical protein HPB48_014917 [Haemaphysalis longicornis]|uniref:Reverse transcriptase zinc-binding domain-containing protein n=1 Tax=Haemaphysalis longicornis TaxID=44386 RepID=A0A9J6GM05_HAELO|nr:hypothetical protein HPB48_014917 [Haemaphysalis longicornis]
MRNIELAQELDETSPENLEEKQKNFPWRMLINANVPGEAQDVTWKYGWSVLQTRMVLRRWGTTTTDKCVHCNQRETNEHAMVQCTVAKTFWLIVSRAYRQLGIRDFLEGRRCPRNPLAVLTITIGLYVLWINTYTAVNQSRPRRNQWNLLMHMHRKLTENLEAELLFLGEEEFLRKWSCPFIEVQNGRVHV